MKQWLTIIGTGAGGIDTLPAASRSLLESCQIIVGPRRLIDNIKFTRAEKHVWSSPMSETLDMFENWRGHNVVVLATGDPMHYGIGATLLRRFCLNEMLIIPAPSAFSLAASRMGWALQDVETLSLHGRPISRLQAFLQPGAKLLILTSNSKTIYQAAEMMIKRGFGRSCLSVLENLETADEKVTSFVANQCADHSFGDFHTLAIGCLADEGAVILPRTPGLPDDAFSHDGQLTKREVRAITLSALTPTPDALLWDVGAGCGSIAIEWMRSAPRARAVAFERHGGRIAMILENACALGTPDLEIVAGELPDTLSGQARPSAIFLGGAVSRPDLFEACWKALPQGGRIVANAVTLEGKSAISARHKQYGGELVQIEISRTEALGALRAVRPSMAVLQWRAIKS